MGIMLRPREEAKMPDLNQRIEAMYRGDCRGAWALIAFLWIAILFVAFMTWPVIPDTTIRIVVAIGGGAIRISNTAALDAMVKHDAEAQEVIYGRDLRELDAT